MLAQATGRMERGEPRPRPTEARVSDEDFLRAVRRDLASVYTDVLREPIPDRLAALLAQLEAAFQPSARTYG